NGIRPAFYYHDDEVVVVASERPVIQTVFNVRRNQVMELTPGSAITVKKSGDIRIFDVLGEGDNRRCSFERIYFSRGSYADIYQERKRLGHQLVPDILKAIDEDLDNTVISFIPNTAEVAFIGMCEELERELNRCKAKALHAALCDGTLSHDTIDTILSRKLRVEKVAIKDIKLRTFIAEGSSRNDLAAHVYDVTYGCIKNGVDNLVVIDDSIVRGTTLRQSILSMLERLHPKRIVVVSSSPQVRYPDCYGIDMSRMGEFIAFKAAVELLREHGMESRLDEVYRRCLDELKKPAAEQVNCVKMIYEPFSDNEISDKIAEMLRPEHAESEIKIVYQTLDGLHKAIPGHPGDWYFSGDYPTPGGTRLVNRAYVNYYEGNTDRR
ncbi:MAG: amidophosphoribosyltransferase, partial [Muribaculaceae bacterium]|nr:amidophosphoribosyltransferase [Muribaculaceae bacterium]